MVFVNAWNEWAEGAVLEPDTRLGHAWLEATRTTLRAPAVDTTTDPRPCAIVHLWYPELLGEFATALRASHIDWRIIITTAPEREQAVRSQLARLQLDAEVHVFENRGRDILPFLHVANRLLDEGVTVVLKLHSKRSTHRRDGELWRRELLDKLLAPERATRILAALHANPTLGMVGPEGHLQPLSYYWGANRDTVDFLCTRLGIAAARAEHDRFVAGSMFWVRLDALRPLLDAQLRPAEFEAEAGQLDGTVAHAIERVFALSVVATGSTLADAATVCSVPVEPPRDYPYAQRSD
jgi:lipopolysaccharide biosynthesis protein